jgi:mRNA interferase HigB
MRVIARKRLSEFWAEHRDAEGPLRAWYSEVKQARWETSQDILDHYRTARTLPDNRVVFKIRRNRYRLVVKVNYNGGIVYIRFVGTHAEYDKIDAETI